MTGTSAAFPRAQERRGGYASRTHRASRARRTPPRVREHVAAGVLAFAVRHRLVARVRFVEPLVADVFVRHEAGGRFDVVEYDALEVSGSHVGTDLRPHRTVTRDQGDTLRLRSAKSAVRLGRRCFWPFVRLPGLQPT